MTIFRKALLFSISFEMFLILLALGGHVGLSVLPYLALAFHFPALYLLDDWPAVRQTLIGPILIQWFIWFLVFAGFFAVRHRFQRHKSGHEVHAA